MPMRPLHEPRFTRTLGLFGFAGAVFFCAVCGAAQFLRTDLDWITTPLSFYLIGSGGAVVKTAYFGLSLSLVAIGTGFYRDMDSAARSAAPLVLFVVSGAALTVTAISETATAAGDTGLHVFVHNVAAMTTFLCVTVAMLLQSWRLRGDARWRTAFVFAFSLAVTAFDALWLYTLVRVLPRGLAQKSVIILILFWLGWASLALRQRSSEVRESSLTAFK
jgi:hypothetical protein